MECNDNASAYESIESSLLSTSHENVNFDDENDLKPLPNTGQSVWNVITNFLIASFAGKHFRNLNRVNDITYSLSVNSIFSCWSI